MQAARSLWFVCLCPEIFPLLPFVTQSVCGCCMDTLHLGHRGPTGNRIPGRSSSATVAGMASDGSRHCADREIRARRLEQTMQTNFTEMVGTADAVMAGFSLDHETKEMLRQECRDLTPGLSLSPDTSIAASDSAPSRSWGCATDDASAAPITQAFSCVAEAATAVPMTLAAVACIAETSASAGPFSMMPPICVTDDASVSASASPASMSPWTCIAGNA